MSHYLRRLATTGAAYTASSVISKLIAVALLPLYTRHLTPTDYGAAEVLLVSVIAASIVVRLGVIEALLRFYYQGGEQPERVVKTAFASLLWTSTAGAALALPFAEPISRALLDRSDPELIRIAIFGLWIFTNYELALALFRLDERARAYFRASIANVGLTIALTVWLVVVQDEGASGLLLGNFLGSTALLAALIAIQRRRLALLPDFGLLGRMLRFGLPTMPAELSLYSLSFIDRIMLARLAGLAEAGLYSLAIKFAQGVTVLVRGFQLAWPPLAYSITDDDAARRAYALIVTWFVAVCSFAVLGLSLLAPWVVRLLAAPEYFGAHRAVPLLAVGVTLYALYLVLVVIAGRAGRTEFNFPVTAIAMAVNIGLNLALIPSQGIVGAGIALVASYVILLALMHTVVRRLFRVPFEWRRLAQVVGLAGGLFAFGELVLPTAGAVGLIGRGAVWLAYPWLLFATGFVSPADVARLVSLAMEIGVGAALRRGGVFTGKGRERSEGAGTSAQPQDADALGGGPQLVDEVDQAQARDEDGTSGRGVH